MTGMTISELFSLRENEIFDTLHMLVNLDFVLIGGYAVSAYTLPRFSVDCDIVVENQATAERISGALKRSGYLLKEESKDFTRYEKELAEGFKVSVDLLMGRVIDRQTGAVFPAEWVFRHSAIRKLKGKTAFTEAEARVIDLDALVALKLVSGRATDARDVFMLLPRVTDLNALKEEVSLKADFQAAIKNLKEKVMPEEFKNSLQGVYGFVDNKTFEKHRKAVEELAGLANRK